MSGDTIKPRKRVFGSETGWWVAAANVSWGSMSDNLQSLRIARPEAFRSSMRLLEGVYKKEGNVPCKLEQRALVMRPQEVFMMLCNEHKDSVNMSQLTPEPPHRF